MALKYKVGDRVKIKSNDFFNNNKGKLSFYVDSMALCFANEIVTIKSYGRYPNTYRIYEDEGDFLWTDEMIEGLAEDLLDKEIQEHQKICDEALTIKGIEPTEEIWHCPEGYQFVDENGNVINAQKIVLEKKKKEYPKTYEECCKVLGIEVCDFDVLYNMLDTSEKNYCNNLDRLLNTFRKLLICRDVYWNIAGEEMGIGRSWKPSDSDYITERYCIFVHRGNILCDTPAQDCFLTFPTEEMRDAFYENFEKLIESVKELL